MWFRPLHIALFATLSLFMAPADATAGHPANVRVIKELSFGQIGRPATGANTFTVHWQNGQVAMGGAGDGFHLGGNTNGRFRFRGHPNRAVTISAEIVDFAPAGISVDAAHLNGTSSSITTSLNASGITMLRLGGRLTIHSNATVGFHETDVILTINYE